MPEVRYYVITMSGIGAERLVGTYATEPEAMTKARSTQTDIGNLSFVYVSTTPKLGDGPILYSVRGHGGP